MKRTLILGYGNPDRQDDGVAWHVLVALAHGLGRQMLDPFEEEFELQGLQPHLLFVLQLTPDLAETVAGYERVCFVDAHTGTIPEEIKLSKVSSIFQKSPFTHHFTPQSCLSLAQTLYNSAPETILVSVRGYEFGFVPTLSERTARLSAKAAQIIGTWLAEVEPPVWLHSS